MKLSSFGEKFTQHSGILELMDDLGNALSAGEQYCMLGGGNPAHIPEINQIWHSGMSDILKDRALFEQMVTNYDSSQGKTTFIESLAKLFRNRYNWNIEPENIGITNGSQTAFFLIFNMLAGKYENNLMKKILFPLMPEYIGYSDQTCFSEDIIGCKPLIKHYEGNIFKYFIDFDNLHLDESTAAVCVSRPTNPTGNVLTDEEIKKLSTITKEAGVPLIIDNAYGTPFPGIIFEPVSPVWDEHIILTMSLSKLGLPGTRTGIVIASQEFIKKLSAINAIVSLSNGSIGQQIIQPLLENEKILEMSKSIIRPYYQKKSEQTQAWIHQAFDKKFSYAIHKSEGALFLWLWFKELKITTKKLYSILKKKKVLVVPGEYFFYGLKEPWPHQNQCIRITYSQDETQVKKGIEIMAEEIAKI